MLATGLDIFVFVGFLLSVMGIGICVGQKENTSEDYFLAGRSIPWYGVAGSIFGTNISANHLVGMLGIGFSIGFAQAHFELGAVAGLLLLAYVFLPVYYKLRIFSLSEYLEKRFGLISSLMYTVTSFILILVQMTAAFYIGSRSLNILLANTGIQFGYAGGIFGLIIVSCTYTVWGGLKAVVWTDLIQTTVLLISGILVAILTFLQPEVGGWPGFMANDAAQTIPKMNLYLPSDHASLPWTGAFTGLMILHFFYWGNNQYLVQRALAAKSLRHARYGVFAGMALKLLVPFFSIAGGIAAAQLFRARGLEGVAPDDAFSKLVTIVVPSGYGILGVIGAGLLGAIISSIDSMMNSAATLASIDIYKKYINKNATEKETIFFGRITIILIVSLSALGAIVTYDPTGKSNFFLSVARQSSNFTPGIVASFIWGIFSKRLSSKGSMLCIAFAPILSYLIDWTYPKSWGAIGFVQDYLGTELNFMHRTMIVFILCSLLGVLFSKSSESKTEFCWDALVEHPRSLKSAFKKCGVVISVFCLLAFLTYLGVLSRTVGAILSSGMIISTFAFHCKQFPRDTNLLADDRFIAGAVCVGVSIILFLF